MKIRLLAASVITAFLLAGCSSVMQYADDAILYGNIWKLEKLNGVPVAAPGGKDVTLAIVAGLNSVTGSGSCNQYFADASVSGNKLTFGNLGSTKMACDDMNLEISYFQKLKEVDSFAVNMNKLTLYSGGKVVLEFSVLQKK